MFRAGWANISGCLGGSDNGNNNDYGPDFHLNLGLASDQLDAGYLRVHGTAPSSSLATPASLKLPFTRPNVTALPDLTTSYIRQVLTPQGLVNVNTISAYEYHLECYYTSDITGTDSDGFLSYWKCDLVRDLGCEKC